MVEYFYNLRVVKSILSKTKTESQRKRLYLLNFLGMVKYLLRPVTTEAKGNKTKQNKDWGKNIYNTMNKRSFLKMKKS